MPRLTEVGASTPVTNSPPMDAWSMTHYILLFFYRASHQALLLLVGCSVLSPSGNIRKESKNHFVSKSLRNKENENSPALKGAVWSSTLFSSCKLYFPSSLYWTQILSHSYIKWEGEKGELKTSNWRYLLMLGWFTVCILYWYNIFVGG